MTRPEWTRDPSAPSLALFVGVALAGFVTIAIGWRVAARTLFVPAQIPALVSGGLAGVALVVVGATLVTVQVGRRLAAVERLETEGLLEEAAGVVAALRDRGDQ